MIQSWENLVTDGRADRRTDEESDFIGRCPTNVERPITLNRLLEWQCIDIVDTHQ